MEQNEFPPASGQEQVNQSSIEGNQNVFAPVQAGGDVTQTFSITQIISVDEVKTHPLDINSPYKGLKKFEPKDSDRFFGREQFCDSLIQQLEQTSIILLLGASGSGKSSVVRAGLIPRLQKKLGNKFTSLIFTPDRDPFESFYAALLGAGVAQSDAQVVRVGQASRLLQVATQVKPSDDFWLLVIDQFEELFTMSDSEKCQCFIDGLVQLGNAKLPLLKVVATMRADFFEHLSAYPNLVTLTDSHRRLLAAMQADELRRAIELPAAEHGVVFEDGLVEEIIKNVQGQAGCLPLLQYTLDLLWQREVSDEGIKDRTLNTTSYWQVGGVRGALQQRVDEIYTDLSERGKLAAQRLFLKLVEIGGDAESGTEWKPVRRRAKRSEFSNQTEAEVLDQLINANLLVSDAAVDGATVEIAHEILLTSWQTLSDWIKENRQAIALRNRLYDDVRLWVKEDKRNTELWNGTRLERANELRANTTFEQALGGFSKEAIAFIEASNGLGKRQMQERIAADDDRRTDIMNLLEACTVKLVIPEQEGSSTGFFVAPGKILTCAPKILEAGTQSIKVFWVDRDSCNINEATIDRLFQSDNLAILKLAYEVNHPCVYLDTQVEVGDPICTYGYSPQVVKDGYGHGKCQKQTEKDRRIIEFATYQNSIELESSPLLNLRTLTVCGIVQSSHSKDIIKPDKDQVTVGKAISTAAVLATVDSLKKEQKTFHIRDPRWSSLFPPRCKTLTVALASLGLVTLVILVRAFQIFQPLELGFYDLLMRNRLNPPQPSDRFLIVTITKEDAEAQENRQENLKYSLSNVTLIRLLQKIETLKPIAIGLDVYRDQTLIQTNSSEKQRLSALFQQPDLFTVCKAPDQTDPNGVSPPLGANSEQVGFSDVSLDSDGILRRHLLAFYPSDLADSECSSTKSFNLLIAERYLQSQEKIQTNVELTEQACQIEFNNGVALSNFSPNTGGYQGYSGDARDLFSGCQVLLNYRDWQEKQTYKTVTLEEFLKPNFPTQDYKNSIVLIGIDRSDGISDNFRTPYDQGSDQVTTGVVIQAQMIDQIIDAALKDNSLIWVLPGQVDLLLILISALIGGGLGWWFVSPRQLGVVVVLSGSAVLVVSVVMFQFGGWVPLMPHFLALLTTSSYVFWSNARLRSAASVKPVKQQSIKPG